MKELGYGKGYKYAHDYPGNIVEPGYLPQEIKGTVYYNPSANGYELKIKEWLEKKKKQEGNINICLCFRVYNKP